MRLPAVLILLCTIAFPTSAATPFWGAKASDAVDVAPAELELGHFVWLPQAAPAGPIVVVVGLDDQIAYAYRNGVRIGYAKVSTGKKGHETPTGVFTTLQKDKDHHSSIYNNAAMPYTQRLTWGGVALHAGGIPDYPSSHGCVHLPSEFARLLFEVSPMGMTVVVGDEAVVPADVAHPAMLEPVDPKSGVALETPRLAAHETSRWQPDLSTEGPVAMLLSRADRRLIVFRNGVEIGRAQVEVRDPDQPLGTHVFTVVESQADGTPRWSAVGVPGHAGEDGLPLDPAQVERIAVPDAFRANVTPLLVPGTTLMVTDAAVLPSTTGVPMTVVTNAAP